MIICITGLPGTGKSKISKLLQQELEKRGHQVRHYTSDWMRFKLFPEVAADATQHARDFTADELERSYQGLYMLFGELLAVDPNLVIITDGTYRKESQRNALKEIAARHEVPFILIKAVVDENKVLARLTERLAKGEGSGPASYLAAKAQYEEPADVLIIENTGDVHELEQRVCALVEDMF